MGQDRKAFSVPLLEAVTAAGHEQMRSDAVCSLCAAPLPGLPHGLGGGPGPATEAQLLGPRVGLTCWEHFFTATYKGEDLSQRNCGPLGGLRLVRASPLGSLCHRCRKPPPERVHLACRGHPWARDWKQRSQGQIQSQHSWAQNCTGELRSQL